MPTVVKTIGTAGGRNYSTIAAWVAALPANLVTDGNIQEGDCYNDSEFVTDQANLAGFTTDSTHYIFLTAAAGQSFQDNANVRTNALYYNQANGVAVRDDANYALLVIAKTDYTRVTRLQLKTGGTPSQPVTDQNNGTPVNMLYKDLLCVSGLAGGTSGAIQIGSYKTPGGILANVVLFLTASGGPGIEVRGSSTAIGCSVIKTTSVTAGGTGYLSSYGSNILQSCTVFGCTTAADTVAWDATNSKNNATDLASGLPGSSNQTSVTYSATTPFTQASTTSTDLRAVASTSLAANGFRDGTNAPNDISGTARASPPTIGHWELVSAVTNFIGAFQTNVSLPIFTKTSRLNEYLFSFWNPNTFFPERVQYDKFGPQYPDLIFRSGRSADFTMGFWGNTTPSSPASTLTPLRMRMGMGL